MYIMTYVTFFPWIGGKYMMMQELMSAFPRDVSSYAEPFMGSGVVTMESVNLYNKVEASDKDMYLYNLHQTMQGEDWEKAVNFFCELPNDPDVFQLFLDEKREEKDSGCRIEDLDHVHAAARELFLIQYSFNATRISHRESRHPGRLQEAERRARHRVEERAAEVHRRLQGIKIREADALDVLEEKGTDGDRFIYVDSPYLPETLGASKQLYQVHFQTQEHQRMLELAKNAKAKIMISGYPSRLYDETLLTDPRWKSYVLATPRRTSSPRDKTLGCEIIWVNYDLPETASLTFSTWERNPIMK